MTTICRIIFASVLLFSVHLHAQEQSDPKSVIERTCLSCHIPSGLVDHDFDYKIWELTVERMSNYSPLTDQEIRDVAAYMASGNFEQEYFPERLAAEEPASSTMPMSIDSLKKKLGITSTWKPSFKTLMRARHLGHLSFLMLIVLIITGYIQSRIKPFFSIVHRIAGYVMILAVAAHAAIFLFKFGAPPVLWFWFGIIASIALIISEITGEIRRFSPTIKTYFVHTHYVAGWVCLIASVLHWVWVWI